MTESTPHSDDPTRIPLERQIMGEGPRFTSAQVAEQTGASLEEVRRLWRALGLPEHDSAEPAYTQADIDAVLAIMAMIDSGAIDLEVALSLTRGLGQTMNRLSDWQTVTLVQRIEELEAGPEATGSRTASAQRLLDDMMAPFESLLGYAWRRHLAAAVARVEALGELEADLMSTELTVGFADIVQFTALSNSIDRSGIGDLVEEFEARCQDVVANHGGRVVKSIGDSVLFTTEGATAGMEIAEGIINVIGRDSRMPDVRLGLATGSVVMRMGDVFGPPVNMAARMTAVARRNRIVIDAATAERLPSDRWESRRMPGRPVRGFGIVEPLTVRRR